MFVIRKWIFRALLAVLVAGFVRELTEQLTTTLYVPSASARWLMLPADARIEMPVRGIRVRQICGPLASGSGRHSAP